MSMMGIALPCVGGAMILAELETDSLRISSASRHKGLWREGMKGEEERSVLTRADCSVNQGQMINSIPTMK